MKAKTKLQRHIVAIDKTLPKITEVQSEWAYEKCLTHYAVRIKSGRITCLDCAHEWRTGSEEPFHDTLTEKKCPNCKVKIEMICGQSKRFKDEEMFQIIDTHKKHQVIRTFLIKGVYFSGHKAIKNYDFKGGSKGWRTIREVSRVYLTPEGKYEIIGHTLIPTWHADRWSNEFSLKGRRSINGHNLNLYFVYPKKKIIKEIKRNGVKTSFHKHSPFNLFYSILNNSKSETLLKANQIELLNKTYNEYELKKIEKYWGSIKICIRNNYIIKSAGDYLDYLSDLEELGKDLLSAKYVCPVDLGKEHQRYIDKIRVLRNKARAEEKKKKIREEEVFYLKLKKRFLGLTFKRKEITLSFIDNVQSVMEIGEALHHCIYQSDYHTKKDSLLFCAWVEGKPKETLEYSIKYREVLQSRGLQNKPSVFHKNILELFEENIPEIERKIKIKNNLKQTA